MMPTCSVYLGNPTFKHLQMITSLLSLGKSPQIQGTSVRSYQKGKTHFHSFLLTSDFTTEQLARVRVRFQCSLIVDTSSSAHLEIHLTWLWMKRNTPSSMGRKSTVDSLSSSQSEGKYGLKRYQKELGIEKDGVK